MPITIKGLKELGPAMRELSQAISEESPEKAIRYYGAQTKQRLDQDTPVRTGRLKRSSVFEMHPPHNGIVGQFAPYARHVNERRNYWSGALRTADLMPSYYKALVAQDIIRIVNKYGGR